MTLYSPRRHPRTIGLQENMEAGQEVCRVPAPDLIPRAHGAPFEYSGTELDSLAYARNYYSWILRQFEPYLASRVIEVGAGLGTFSEFLLSNGRVEQLITIEPGTNTFPHLAARFASDSRVTVLHGYLGDHCGSLVADAVAAVNVLEHVDDDARFLEEARESVVTGERCCCLYPRCPAFLDRSMLLSIINAGIPARRFIPSSKELAGKSGVSVT